MGKAGKAGKALWLGGRLEARAERRGAELHGMGL